VKKRRRRKHRKNRQRQKREDRRGDLTTKHHVWPKSRGGSNDKKNIYLVRDQKHRAYHLLFGNKTPPEAIRHLIKVWFKGQYCKEILKEIQSFRRKQAKKSSNL